MTDLVLIGIFILCAVIGYIVIKRSGGFLEHILFQKSEMWYHLRESNVRESNEPCRDAGAGNACSQAISRDSGSIGRMPASPEKRSFFGQGTAQESKRTKMPVSPEKRSFFGQGTAQEPKDFKAGIKHEWKASGSGPKQQVWKPQ